jgi:aminoglycoside phosphotransferase (APT) family kinase protein
MHADEVPTDAELVRRLVAAQFPEWAGLPIRPVPSGGTDNAIYRLGDDLAVRLPRVGWAVGQVGKEHRWLPRLAPHLPLAVPVPLAAGEPGEGYPWPWSVCRWLDGENATLDRLSDPCRAAEELAGFLIALRGIDPAGGPPPGEHNSGRGVPLAERDARVRESLAALNELGGEIDTDAAAAIWEDSLAAPAWDGPPVWLHGDLQSGNLLAQNGRLSAVIDFGCLGVGDPACDLMVAWNLFTGESRAAFRATLAPDDASWARGRGWALSVGLIALPYYLPTSPAMVRYARHTIAAVLGDGE